MSEMTCKELIEKLGKFPDDKSVRILATGGDCSDDVPEPEDIDDVGYGYDFYEEYDDGGKPIFHTDESCVYIFSDKYSEFCLMNGV